jgi:DNA-binding CsgD family transcriptional regulator
MAERKQPEFYQLNTQSFFESFAKRYLTYLGNNKPNKTQLTEMMDLLSHVWLRHLVTMDTRLTEAERQCLYLFAQGKNATQVAKICVLSLRQVARYREIYCVNYSVMIWLKL